MAAHIDQDWCLLCYACYDLCPVWAIVYSTVDVGGIYGAEGLAIDQDACICCGECYEVCPADAVLQGDCNFPDAIGGGTYTSGDDDGDWGDDTGSGSSSDSNLIDFSKATDSLIITTVLNALGSGSCILSELFTNLPTGYQSDSDGTELELCGTTYTVIIDLSCFDDDLAMLGYQVQSDFTNLGGCWTPIQFGNGSQLLILISCTDDFRNFLNCTGI